MIGFRCCGFVVVNGSKLSISITSAVGWVPKANIVGSEERVYILDFFGSKGGLRKPLSGQGGLNVPPHRILTAFGSPVNTFLGYYMQEKNTSVRVEKDLSSVKLKQGMVWGKDAKHFVGADKLLKAVADDVKLVSTASVQVFAHRNVHWAGHQNAAGWTALLRQSRRGAHCAYVVFCHFFFFFNKRSFLVFSYSGFLLVLAIPFWGLLRLMRSP